MLFQKFERDSLVFLRQRAVSDHVGKHDGCELAFLDLGTHGSTIEGINFVFVDIHLQIADPDVGFAQRGQVHSDSLIVNSILREQVGSFADPAPAGPAIACLLGGPLDSAHW